jgi:hypothetical protein
MARKAPHCSPHRAASASTSSAAGTGLPAARLPPRETSAWFAVSPQRAQVRTRQSRGSIMSNGRSPWWSTSPPPTRAPSAPARARSRRTWRARSIGRAGTAERRSVPRRHGDAQGVALVIAAAAAAKLSLEVYKSGVRRPAVLQEPGVDVGPLSAGGTGRDDHMPGAQIVEPDRVARRDVLVLFHSTRAMPERAGEQARSAGLRFGGDRRGR